MSFSILITLFVIIADIVVFFVLRKKLGFTKAFFIAGGSLAAYMVLFFIFVTVILQSMALTY